MGRPAAFLDRDGVLVPDVHLAARPDQLKAYPWVPAALDSLRRGGFAIVVVSNQTVVARGLASEADVERLQNGLGLAVDAFYYCPHHPEATLGRYRVACECRKPRPGLLLRAARELDLDLKHSFMVGDRPSDIEAGRRAGCRTIRVRSGAHDAPPIVSPDPFDADVAADYECADLREAAAHILESAA